MTAVVPIDDSFYMGSSSTLSLGDIEYASLLANSLSGTSFLCGLKMGLIACCSTTAGLSGYTLMDAGASIEL